MDKLTSNILLPLGGLFVAIFAAWIMRRESSREELALKSMRSYQVWLVLVRYIAPVGVILIFLQAIGLIGL
jgi:NSS family neurotransmitter:Na+ symporter